MGLGLTRVGCPLREDTHAPPLDRDVDIPAKRVTSDGVVGIGPVDPSAPLRAAVSSPVVSPGRASRPVFTYIGSP